MKLEEIFIQQDNILNINYLNLTITFKMPEYFNIDKVSDDLKMLCLILLFYPIDEELIKYKFTRKSSGNKIGLAFSGGVDSTAAYCLLPKNNLIIFHHKRIVIGSSQYKNDNPLFVINHLPSDVLIIDSTLEEVRKLTGSYSRFLNDFSFFAGFVLLSDYLNIGYLSTGMMLESTYIKKGYQFVDFHNSTYYKKWFHLFKRANLSLFFPCIPCSEILTNKIVKINNVFAQSCIRGTKGEGCGTCYKCFRKKLLNGIFLNNYKSYEEINRILNHRPLKQGASLIYAMNKINANIPELQEYKGRNLDFLENYFEYTLNSIPEEFRDYLKKELNKYTTSLNEDAPLKSFKL